jgi:NADPH-dependent curcumin reductase CurA
MENRQWILKARPTAGLSPDVFAMEEHAVPAVAEGQVLVSVELLSCDPAQLGWMTRDTYKPKMPVDAPVRRWGAGKVVESKHPSFQKGDQVVGMVGWQEFALCHPDRPLEALQKVPAGVNLQEAVSVLGITGLTAYFGMELANIKASDKVVVSGAAGATGSVAAQIARIKGAEVLGIAGSQEKCMWLREKARLDATANYKTDNLAEAIAKFAPKGIDAFFDNVGGDALEAVLENLAIGARVVICGAISQYTSQAPSGPSNYLNLVMQRATMQGFLVTDFIPRFAAGAMELGGWIRAGELAYAVDVVSGIENAPTAFAGLFTGRNLGKLLVSVQH